MVNNSTSPQPPDIRVCFIGDSFVNGTGDPEYLGWVGRICQQAAKQGHDLTSYNLGARRETSLQIEQRWQQEVACRLPETCEGRLVFSFGVNDTTYEEGQSRVNPGDSIACARRMLTAAQSIYPVLMIGPPPIADKAQNTRIETLSQLFAEVCQDLAVPYLDIYKTLVQSPIWNMEVASGDGAHPSTVGYTMLADLIQQWKPWKAWFPSKK
ncbi:MAG TPA: GDSL-type esterase/lipase family protein [Leptolyngbyaceae cyanobacterium]